jgi:ubiquinone/menaquinone biosynthesis C-methylase UbiE
VSFEVTADAYDAFMGRFSGPLAGSFADLLDLQGGQRVLDVGSGPGALTTELVARLGPGQVTAVDPMPAFNEAVATRLPGVDVRRAKADDLPFHDDTFDATAAQLVVHFMPDPAAGIREMARVTRPGGALAACLWDNAGEGSPVATFWHAVHSLDPQASDEAVPASTEGALARIFDEAGLDDVRSTTISSRVTFASFEDWWEPFTYGVGPAGAHTRALDAPSLQALAQRCRELMGEPPFEVTAVARAVVGRVSAGSARR